MIIREAIMQIVVQINIEVGNFQHAFPASSFAQHQKPNASSRCQQGNFRA